MVLKDKIILITLQKKNIPQDVAFIILKYYKKMLDINIEIEDTENTEISSSNKMQIFLILICAYGFILLLILLLVLTQHSILDNI